MGRFPNHRFSIAKDRTVSPFESAVDSIKRHMPFPFARTTKGQASSNGNSPVSSLETLWCRMRASSDIDHATQELAYKMGNKTKKQQNYFDLGEATDDSHNEPESMKRNVSKRERNRGRNEDKNSVTPQNGDDGEISEDQELSKEQSDSGLDPYIARVEDLKMKLEACRTVAEDSLAFYTNHQVEIQRVDTTRQQLKDMTEKCNDYRNMITGIRRLEGEAEQALAIEKAGMKKDRKKLDDSKEELDDLKEEAARYVQQLAEERSAFEVMTRRKAEEQLVNLQEEKAKLEIDNKKQLAKRVEDLEKGTKKSQDDDKKKISDLQKKNDMLEERLKEQGQKLTEAAKSYKDCERLKSLSETENEGLTQQLEKAKNKFGLIANTTEYLHVSTCSKTRERPLTWCSQSEFLKIQNNVRTIAKHYVEQMKVDVEFPNYNLCYCCCANIIQELDDAVHDKLEEADADFTSVPISNTLVSKELCLMHFQRVISSQLLDILWTPFSSEKTVQDPIQASLLNDIYYGLAQSSDKDKGFHAARTFAALTIRSLHSQSMSNIRTELFVENITKVLFILLNSKIHPALRKALTQLATSAIALWSIVQNDERELHVKFTVDLTSFEKPEEGIDLANSEIFVLFPCVTARSCSVDDHTVSPPGRFEDFKPEIEFKETSIHNGVGMPDWDQLVRAGEDEEIERKKKQVDENNKIKRRKFEEEMEKSNKPILAHKRVNSNSRRSSVGVGKLSPTRPTSVSLVAQKVPEKVS